MRTVKFSALLSGICGLAVTLGMLTTAAHADVTTERGASILSFPKVRTSESIDTVIQIANVSNTKVHARCFYVNALPVCLGNGDCSDGGRSCSGTCEPRWQVTDFQIWLTKQQPTHWYVSSGRRVNPIDSCFENNGVNPEECESAGIDPGFIPPVPEGFEGELRCVEVNVADEPFGGNHLKGEATLLFAGGDVAKYNAVGFEGTDLAGETGNELILDQPHGEPDALGQYNACPESLMLNHITEGATDPVILAAGQGGTCKFEYGTDEPQESKNRVFPCESNDDCYISFGGGGGKDGVCDLGPQIADGAGNISLRSATLTDLTLVPCSADYENQIPSSVTVQFEIYNEFEQLLTASTTVECWRNFRLFEVTSPNDPELSQFSHGIVGTRFAHTRILPIPDGGSVIGVAGVTRADNKQVLTRTLSNLHMRGYRIGDTMHLPDHF